MAEEEDFRDLIRRVRAGDERAAVEVVRRYEPAIRRAVRVRLRDLHLRRLVDSMDVCQSVLLSFFVRTAAGQYDLDTPAQLLKLLATMARNKLLNQAHKQQAGCRDYRRVEAGAAGEREVAGAEATPSRHAAAQELLQETYRRLGPEERRLLELRQQGLPWDAVAAAVGGHADALKKKLARAVDRVAEELGLNEVAHEQPGR